MTEYPRAGRTVHPADRRGRSGERPASVVKELIENSLDAGSRRIVLEIKGGGKELIRIADDGCGIQPAEVELALERHTTSKIRNSDDLSNLSTFGFRGEALPSIASVSKMELVTRSANSPSAVSLTLEGGKLVSKKECARAPGTTMEVRSLFFNTPARLKFLKSDPTEKGRILKVFEEIALAHPEISFEIKIEQRAAGEYPSRTKPIQRVLDLWGESVDESKLVPILFEHPQIRIEGWIRRRTRISRRRICRCFTLTAGPLCRGLSRTQCTNPTAIVCLSAVILPQCCSSRLNLRKWT